MKKLYVVFAVVAVAIIVGYYVYIKNKPPEILNINWLNTTAKIQFANENEVILSGVTTGFSKGKFSVQFSEDGLTLFVYKNGKIIQSYQKN